MALTLEQKQKLAKSVKEYVYLTENEEAHNLWIAFEKITEESVADFSIKLELASSYIPEDLKKGFAWLRDSFLEIETIDESVVEQFDLEVKWKYAKSMSRLAREKEYLLRAELAALAEHERLLAKNALLRVEQQELKKKIADTLVENCRDASINLTDSNGRTQLFHAVLGPEPSIAIIKDLLARGADVHLDDNDGETPLYWAAGRGYEEIVKILLAHGADVDRANNNGNTPLFHAILNNHIEVVKLLLAHGADANLANKRGETPLYRAAGGQTKIVRLLLTWNVDVNRAANNGYTPLHGAVATASPKIVKLLLAHGADVNLADKDGKTPLALSIRNKHAYHCEDCHVGMVKLLLAHGADVSRADSNNETWWHRTKNSKIHVLLQTTSTLGDLWVMETPNYSSFFQWLPREMVQDTTTVMLGNTFTCSNLAEEKKSNSYRF